jgi:hypothetical protein
MTIITTRAQRRELERENAKRPAQLALVPRTEWPLEHQRSSAILRVWRSRDFLVQEYAEAPPVLVRLSVLRTTLDPKAGRWVDGITWDELQRLKAECGYGRHDAVELYPADQDVVNVANLRHLWVMRELVEFAWRDSSRRQPQQDRVTTTESS